MGMGMNVTAQVRREPDRGQEAQEGHRLHAYFRGWVKQKHHFFT